MQILTFIEPQRPTDFWNCLQHLLTLSAQGCRWRACSRVVGRKNVVRIKYRLWVRGELTLSERNWYWLCERQRPIKKYQLYGWRLRAYANPVTDFLNLAVRKLSTNSVKCRLSTNFLWHRTNFQTVSSLPTLRERLTNFLGMSFGE